MLEVWRPVVGYEELYEVSSYGKVRSLDRVMFVHTKKYDYNKIQKGRILKHGTTPNGHRFVTLCDENGQKQTYVHRIVAEAFIQNEDNLPVVDHIDGDPSNNRADNLRWVSYSQNIDNRPEYRKLLSRIEELESEVKRCQTEVLRLQTLCKQSSIAFTKSD